MAKKYLFHIIHLTDIGTPTNSQQPCTTPNKIYYGRNTGNCSTITLLHNKTSMKTKLLFRILYFYIKIIMKTKDNPGG